MPFYESGRVRIHYEEVGSGFPLLVIPGGGLNSTVAGLATHPFSPFDEFKGQFRVIAAVPAQPSGYRPELPGLSYNNNMKVGPGAVRPPARYHDGDGRYFSGQHVRWCSRRFRVHRDTRFRPQLPDADLGVCPTTFRDTPMPWRWRPCISCPTRR